MQIPVPVMKLASKAGTWLIKNGPKIMTIAGGTMAIGGAAMACEATLHADEILDRHKQKMAKIEEAKRISDETAEEVEEVYTEKDMKRDKAIVWAETARDFVKLYAPAITMGLSGIALMHGAFHIMENRHTNALAALTALDQAYNELLAKNPETETIERLPIENEEHVFRVRSITDGTDTPFDENVDQLILSKYIPVDKFDVLYNDPFTIVVDSSTEDCWTEGNCFIINANQIDTTFNAFKHLMAGYTKPFVRVNDIRRAFCNDEFRLGWDYGYSAFKGDVIEYDVYPFVEHWENDLLVGMSAVEGATNRDRLELLKKIELEGVDKYRNVIVLRNSNDKNNRPSYIANEVYGR